MTFCSFCHCPTIINARPISIELFFNISLYCFIISYFRTLKSVWWELAHFIWAPWLWNFGGQLLPLSTRASSWNTFWGCHSSERASIDYKAFRIPLRLLVRWRGCGKGGNTPPLLAEVKTYIATLEINAMVSQKIGNWSTLRPSNTTLGHISKSCLIIPQGHVHSCIHNSQNLEAI